MAINDDNYGLTMKDLKRLATMLKWYESRPLNTVPKPTPAQDRRPVRNALTTSTITARSGTTKGSGTATLYVDDQTGTGNMTVLQTGVKIWNVYGSYVPSGTWVVVESVDGLPQLSGADCSG